MGIFITDNDTFDIVFYIGTIDGNVVCCSTENEAMERFKEFEKHTVSFKKINYGTQKKIQMACLVESEGKFVFNPVKFRTERFTSCLRKWSFKDNAGNIVPVNQQSIDSLSGEVVSFLLDEFDKKI